MKRLIFAMIGILSFAFTANAQMVIKHEEAKPKVIIKEDAQGRKYKTVTNKAGQTVVIDRIDNKKVVTNERVVSNADRDKHKAKVHKHKKNHNHKIGKHKKHHNHKYHKHKKKKNPNYKKGLNQDKPALQFPK